MSLDAMDDDPLEALKKLKAAQAGDDPLAQLKALRPPQPNIHAEFASGRLQKRMQRENTNDQEAAEADQQGYGTRLATHVLNAAQGIPGVEAVEAGAGALGSQATAHPMGYTQSLQTLRGQTGQIGGKTRAAEKMLGSVAVAPFLPSGAVAGGATLGAADAALSADRESLTARGLKTAGGAAIGAAGGKLLGGFENAAQRMGLTDAVAGGLSKLGGKAASVAEAIGTKGAGNRLLAARQSLADELSGSEQSAAQTMIDHVNHYKEQAKALYQAAKQDNAVISDPRVQRVLNDPRVQQMLQVSRDRLGLGQNETVIQAGRPEVPRLLPGPTPPEIPPIDPGNPQSLLDAIKAFDQRKIIAAQRTEGTVAQQQARAELERRSAIASLPTPPARAVGASLNPNPTPAVPEVTADLPTPEELAMTKRLLSHVIEQRFNAPQGISSAEAAQMAPLLDQLRSGLHDASPAWKQADQFYAQAKNFETAYQKAFGVTQKAGTNSIDPSKLKTPEAINAWVQRAQGTPLGVARASGQQAGTAGRLNEALRGAPLGTDIAETLRGANGVFQSSPAAASLRRPAFASDDAAQQFASLLGRTTAQGEKQAASFGPQSVSPFKPWQALSSQNPLATPQGTQLRAELAAALGDPSKASAIRAQLSQSAEGMALLRTLLTGSLAGGNAAFAR